MCCALHCVIITCVKTKCLFHLQEKERSSAFKAIGLIAIAVRQDIEKHRGPVFEQVKVLFPLKDLGHK